MKNNFQTLSTFLFLSSLLLFPTGTLAGDSAIVIFDGSGSMRKKVDGKPKFEIAQEVMGNLVKDWNEDIKLGLMVYGHRSKSCDDIEMMIPVGNADPKQFIDAIKKINPKGETPIAESLKQAAEKLNYIESPTTIILISDGEESCHANPCAMAKELEKKGINFTAHVIGFDVSGKKQARAQEQLKCIAKETGGKFFEAKDSEDLKTALAETAKVIAKPKVVIEPVSVPKMKVVSAELHDVDEPLSVELDTVYKVALKQNEESYFQLSTPISNAKVILDIHQANNRSTNIQGGLSILDEDGIKIKGLSITFNEIDIGYRGGLLPSSKDKRIIGFRVVNTNSNSIKAWLTVLKEDETLVVPFFGKIMPTPMTLEKKSSGMLNKDSMYAYHSIFLNAGDYKVVVGFSNLKRRNTNIQGYFAILDPNGLNQKKFIRFNEIDVSSRKAATFSIKKEGAYIMRLNTENSGVKYNLKIRKK
jgi:hypothetical protein